MLEQIKNPISQDHLYTCLLFDFHWLLRKCGKWMENIGSFHLSHKFLFFVFILNCTKMLKQI